MTRPKGIDLEELAADLVGQIDAYQADISDFKDRWDTVMNVYNDAPEHVLTSITWPSDVKRPYNWPLLQPRADALADDLTDNLTRARPIFTNLAKLEDQESEDSLTGVRFIVAGDDIREKKEQAVDFALRRSNFEKRVRDSVLSSILKGRGALRLQHVSVKNDSFDEVPDGMYPDQAGLERRYVGLYLESFAIEDFVCYPSTAENIQDSQTHGHRFVQRMKDILAKSKSGLYFGDLDFEFLGSGDVDQTVEENEDDSKECYDLLTRIWDDDKKEEVLWRVVLLKNDQKILSMEQFSAPRSWYVAPSIRYEANRFLPSRSLFEKGMELQTLVNDCVTAIVTGSLASAMQSLVIAGGTMDSSNVKLGFGEVLQVKATPTSMTTLGGGAFNPGGLFNMIEYCERAAEQLFRVGAAGVGGESQRQMTATQVSVMAEGQSRGYRSYTSNLALELEALAELAAWLIEQNFEDYTSFYGELFPCQSMADIESPAVFELNSRSPNLSPDSTIAKIEKFAALATGLGVPFDAQKALRVAANALDLGDSLEQTENAIPPAMGMPPPGDGGAAPGLPIGA